MLHDFAAWPKGPLYITIGVFDGVHVGHQAIVRATAAAAARAGGTAVACTFDPLPIEVLAASAPPSALSEIDERSTLLERSGARAVAVIHFTRELSLLTPEEFVARVAGAGDVRSIRVGENFRFGHDRAGNVAILRDLGKRHGFAVDAADPVLVGGRVASSTRVRNALLAGDLAEAERVLGRRYAVGGRVAGGDAHGRALGFPTIELAVPRNRLLPRDGVYAVRAAGRPAAANLGERRLEAYLLEHGETQDELSVEFVARLRDELRFESQADAATQIAKDVEAARRALGAT